MEYLPFSIAYVVVAVVFSVTYILEFIKKYFKKKYYTYGTCNNRKARKNKIHGNVQFVLWKKGEQGHKEDFWIDFDSSWWDMFKKY